MERAEEAEMDQASTVANRSPNVIIVLSYSPSINAPMKINIRIFGNQSLQTIVAAIYRKDHGTMWSNQSRLYW